MALLTKRWKHVPTEAQVATHWPYIGLDYPHSAVQRDGITNVINATKNFGMSIAMVSGSMEVDIDGDKYTLQPGDELLIPPNVQWTSKILPGPPGKWIYSVQSDSVDLKKEIENTEGESKEVVEKVVIEPPPNIPTAIKSKPPHTRTLHKPLSTASAPSTRDNTPSSTPRDSARQNINRRTSLALDAKIEVSTKKKQIYRGDNWAKGKGVIRHEYTTPLNKFEEPMDENPTKELGAFSALQQMKSFISSGSAVGAANKAIPLPSILTLPTPNGTPFSKPLVSGKDLMDTIKKPKPKQLKFDDEEYDQKCHPVRWLLFAILFSTSALILLTNL